jgi:hypothetical protein
MSIRALILSSFLLLAAPLLARDKTGDWSVPKTDASAATIGVDPEVVARLLRLPTLTGEVCAGRAVRKHKLVKSGGPIWFFKACKKGAP